MFSILSTLRKHWAVFILAFFVLLAVFLRLYKVEERYLWHGDTARDLLVSKHIWLYGESLNVGHYASGLPINESACQVRYYPSYYYQLLAYFWLIGRSVYGISIVLILLHSCGVLCSYLIVKFLVNRTAAILTAGLFAVTYTFLFVSQYATSLLVPIPFLLAAVWIVLLGYQRQKLWLSTVGLALLMYFSTFHYSALLLFGFFFLVTQGTFSTQTPRGRLVRGVSHGAAFLIFFLLLHAPIISSCGGIWQFIKMFIPQQQSEVTLAVHASKAAQIFWGQTQTLFRLWTPLLVCFMVISTVIAVRFSAKARTQLGLLGALIGIFVFAGSYLQGTNQNILLLQTLYLRYVIFFFACVALGYTVTFAEESKSFFWKVYSGIQVVVFVLSLSILFAVFVPIQYPKQLIDLARYLEHQEYQPYEGIVENHNGKYDAVVLAFWKEEITHQKFYDVGDGHVTDGLNYSALELTPKYKLFACDILNSQNNCEEGLQQFQSINKLYMAKPTPLTYNQYIITIFERVDGNEK